MTKKIELELKTNRLPGAGDSQLRKFSKMVPFVVIGVACFCAYYLLNINTPPIGDDMFLKYVYQDYFVDKITAPKVTSISQIFEGMTLYYNIFRGRVIAQGLTQLFAVYGKQYFNILNSLVFVGITSLVYFHSNYGKKASWRLYLIISVVFWFFTPDLMATSLWMAGSLNECWVVFFALLFLLPYRIFVSERGNLKHPFIITLFVIPIGFLAGAFNFQSFGLSIGFVILTIVFVIINKKRVPIWSIVGLISTICGTLFVLLAPGNKVECLIKYGKTPLGLFFDSFPNNVFNSISMSFKITKVLLLFAVIVIVWIIIDISKTTKATSKKKKKAKQKESKFSINALADNQNGLLVPVMFFFTTVGSVVVATALPYFDDRLFFTVFVCFTLVVFSLLSEAAGRIENSESNLKNIFSTKYLRIAVPILISLVAVFDFGKEFRIYHRDFIVYTDVVTSIEEKIAAGEKDIVIHKNTEIIPFLLKDGRLRNFIFYWAVTGVGDDTDAMENKWYAYCFGANTLTVTE